MFFSPKKLLSGAILLSSFVAADDKCSKGPWVSPQRIGGQKGGHFCETKWDEGAAITGIQAWADDDSVRGLQFFYSDGTYSMVFGKEVEKKKQRIDWEPFTDTVDQVKLWGNGNGKYLGRIQVTIKRREQDKNGNDKIKTFDLDIGKDTSGQDTYQQNVGAGVILGAWGGHGEKIDSLGFLFLKSKVVEAKIDDVTFTDTPENLNKRMAGLNTKVVGWADHSNNHPNANETYTFANKITQSVEKKYSTKNSHAFGYQLQIELSGKLLDIGPIELGGSVSHTLKYDYTHESSQEESKKDEVEQSWSVATLLKPGQRVYCEAVAMTGTYNGDYNSTLSLRLEDGDKFTFKTQGTMQQTHWSQASSSCQCDPFKTDKREEKSVAGRILY